MVVVAGETGSGKSTQLPKMCLEVAREGAGLIGHTQPRRIAARAVAERVAAELGGSLGGVVGYTVRFTDRVGPDTRIKVMTDGILLNELQRDHDLRRYQTLIIDEAHERSLNIDFILGYLKRLLPRRRDLRLVITSATIDTARFSAHFGDAPVIEVSGRAYPVEVRYRPLVDEADDLDRDLVSAIGDAVDELCGEGPGDVLVFLSGEREIRDATDALRRRLASLERTMPVELLPLFARLSMAEQHRVFAPHSGRRIVLATNVAETSLTVPGVRYVVDAGTARISRYNRRTKVQRLPIEPVSRASADQRAGRCGRIGPGVCIRLYSEDDYVGRPAFTDPEILRTNLASVILRMASIGLGDVERFPFVDPPEARNIRDGLALLEELGAVEPGSRSQDARLTPLGRRLAELPVDPRLGRMILEADRLGCADEVLVIAAALSIQDPRERPPAAGAGSAAGVKAGALATARQEVEALHARFADPHSDFLAYLALWQHVQERQDALTSSQFRRLCRAEHLHYLRVREWQDVREQLRQVTRSMRIRRTSAPDDHDRIHRALLVGLLSHVGMRDDERREYLGARDARFTVARGSVLFDHPPKWVMAAELVETERLRARTVARIRPEWLERAGAHLLKWSHGDVWWDAARGAAVTTERATLYGLPVVADRRINLGRVDAAAARELFIRHALVEGDWDTHHAFAEANRRLLEDVAAYEARIRLPGVLAGDNARYAFFDARVPAQVTSARHFDRWWNGVRMAEPERLTLRWEDVVSRHEAPAAGAFPEEWKVGDAVLPLSYRFEPGAPDDGVTVHVPVGSLTTLRPEMFEWHVAGLRHELVTALLRGLPKPLRRNFLPAPDVARAFVAEVDPDGRSLLEALAAWLARRTGVLVPHDAWAIDAVEPHLQPTFAVEDAAGNVLATSKSLTALQEALHRGRRARGTPADDERARRLREAVPLLAAERKRLPARLQLALVGTRPTLDELLDDCLRATMDDLALLHDTVVRAAKVVLAGRSVERRLDRLTTAALEATVADVGRQLARLVYPGFVTATGPERLDDLFRYVTAMERRLDRVGEAPARDRARAEAIRRLEDDYEALLRSLPPSRRHTSAVRAIRWLLEELRVSEFAQAVGVAEPVSEARIRRAMEEARRV